MKTPKEVAFDAVNGISAARNASDRNVSLMLAVAIAAIEADRARRAEEEAGSEEGEWDR